MILILVASIDGSWSQKRLREGIGRIIKNKLGQIVFLFSGPTLAQDSFHSEIEALCHVIRIHSLSSLAKLRMVICSDSKQLEIEFNNSVWSNKRNLATSTNLERLGLDIDLVGLKVQYIMREFNEAHELAVRGEKSRKYHCYWAQ